MNRSIFLNLFVISMAVGFVLGLLAVIPYVGLFILLLMMFFSSVVAILLLIMLGKLDLTTVKDSIIQGAISGIFANITFSAGYCITSSLIFILWKHTSNYFLTTMIINSPLFLLVVVILFLCVLTAITNAFSGFCLYYSINYIRDIYEKKHQNLTYIKEDRNVQNDEI